MLVDYIKSPKTNRDIKVGGPTYQALLKTRYASKVRNARRFKKPAPGQKSVRKPARVTSPSRIRLRRAQPASLEKTLKRVPASRKGRRRRLKQQISRQSQGRGSRTRGWAAAAPQRGKERHELLKECGEECFLIPEREAFPICPALREDQGCAVDCRGITSAKVRAAQWKYPKVYEAATRLEKQYDCDKPVRKTTRRRRGGRRGRKARD